MAHRVASCDVNRVSPAAIRANAVANSQHSMQNESKIADHSCLLARKRLHLRHEVFAATECFDRTLDVN
jgi:hypothetical protein